LEGKITSKCVEERLGEEYKSNYHKCEQNSPSKKVRRSQEMAIDNSGKVHSELVSPKHSETEISPSSQKVREPRVRDDEGTCPSCSELEEALRKASPISTASGPENGSSYSST
jgi:hypothetical protein